jgi:hypothetical protein
MTNRTQDHGVLYSEIIIFEIMRGCKPCVDVLFMQEKYNYRIVRLKYKT